MADEVFSCRVREQHVGQRFAEVREVDQVVVRWILSQTEFRNDNLLAFAAFFLMCVLQQLFGTISSSCVTLLRTRHSRAVMRSVPSVQESDARLESMVPNSCCKFLSRQRLCRRRAVTMTRAHHEVSVDCRRSGRGGVRG